jgi:predicted RNase H-like HicB family nuclease
MGTKASAGAISNGKPTTVRIHRPPTQAQAFGKHLSPEVLRITTPHANPMDFLVVLKESAHGNFIADVPQLPGCHTQGRTKDEAMRNVREAIELYLSVEGPGPQRVVSVEHVTVEA